MFNIILSLIYSTKLSLKYNTFFSVNDTLILVIVFHKNLPSRGAGQPARLGLPVLINFCFSST